jgi:hypothetical protein
MLFRPSFCCNCGEKIERAEWKLWTSRRFCELCATNFSLQDYAVRGVILLASVIAVFGVVRFLVGGAKADLVASKTADKAQNAVLDKGPVNVAPSQTPLQSTPAVNSIEDRRPQTFTAMPPANASFKPPADPAEGIYICGAATKKGTPCSRKVKGNVRCFQHLGQPAMLPASQLRVSR